MPKILEILKIPTKSLRKKSEIVDAAEIKNKVLQELCDNLEKTMLEKEGIGLAAPQVGQNIRLIVVNTKNGPILLFNPRITKKSLRKEWGEEGCLSVPLIFGQVKRHKKITCNFCNRQGSAETIKASGLLARVLQHEIDHLDGVLFIDKAKDLQRIDETDIEE